MERYKTYLEGTDCQNQVRRLNNVLNLRRVRSVAGIDTTICWVFFVNSTFTHRSDKDGEICLFDEVVNFVKDTMTNGTSIDKDDRVLCGTEVLENDVNDVCFALGIIWRLRQVNWLLEPGTFYLGLDHIGGKHDVDGSRTDEANSEGMVNLSSDFGRVGELGHFTGDLSAHVGEDVEITVSEGVVEEHAVSL